MTKLKITVLPQESVFSCPHCAVMHTIGRVFVEVEHEGQVFVFAELVKCCGELMPVPVLFDSRQSARHTMDRLGESIRIKSSPFFQLPLVSKASFFAP